MFDVAAQSYSTVDEFDEPKEGKPTLEQSVDSFEKLLADPTVQSPDGNFVMVNTASGRWGYRNVKKLSVGSKRSPELAWE